MIIIADKRLNKGPQDENGKVGQDAAKEYYEKR
jgi:hypothetical protein